jgi:hypothetical protein
MKFVNLLAHLVVFLACNQLNAQDFGDVKTYKDAKEYVSAHPGSGIAFLHSEMDNQEVLKRFDQKQRGDTVLIGNYLYKVLNTDRIKHYRFQYIYLNSELLGALKTKEAQTEILKRLEEGEDFQVLHKEFNMDGNANFGDIGWISDTNLPEYLKNVLLHSKIGEIKTCNEQESLLIVKILKNPKCIKGFYAIYDKSSGPSKYETEIMELGTMQEIRAYVHENPEVSLQLFDSYHDSTFYSIVEKDAATRFEKMYDYNEQRVRILKDTLISLLDFDYIYVDITTEKELLNKIIDNHDKGSSFEELRTLYATNENAFHSMHMIDSGLLHAELADVLLPLSKYDVRVVPIQNSVFICKVNEPKIDVKAYLGIVFQ